MSHARQHIAKAEELATPAVVGATVPGDLVALAQVHATIALAKSIEDFVAAALGDTPPRVVVVS